MALMRRIMWPKVGEDVEVYQNGKLVAAGHVTYSGDDVVRILGSQAETMALDSRQLMIGIDDRSVVVKKKARLSRV